MSGEIMQYITDHNAASDCVMMHYQGQHDNSRCVLPPGYCSMYAYMVSLLKRSEVQQYPAATPVPFIAPPPASVPVSPIPPVTSGALPLTYDGNSGTNAYPQGSGGVGGGQGSSSYYVGNDNSGSGGSHAS
jgi:hypothetical protein